MLGGVDEPDAVGLVLQERLAGSHVAQDAGLAFPAQVVRDAAQFGDQLDQPGGLVGVELIHDEHPSRAGIGGDGGADVADEIRLGAGFPDRGADELAGGDLEVGDQGLGPVPVVLELAAFQPAGGGGLVGMDPFQGLDAGFLVRADQVDAALK